jgi:hypothetical protein
MPAPDPADFPPELQIKRILSLQEAALLRGVSVDTLKRRYSHLIVKLSPRRAGMSVGDALSIGTYARTKATVQP